MKAVTKEASKVLNTLVSGLEFDKSRKIDNSNGTFMPVIAELIGGCELGKIYSVAHYFKQN